MKLITESPQKALKALLKQKPLRSDMDVFKTNLVVLLDKIGAIEKRATDETEEHLKNDLRDFLRDTYYKEANAINTKDKKDLVIHLDKTTDSDVGMIIEAKRPNNLGEMVSAGNPNKKALHELILYYLDEREKNANFQLKNLAITNICEWYIFDANDFDKYVYNNAQIKNLYKTKTGDGKNNPFFYQEIEKIIAKTDIELPCVYFDIRDYEAVLRGGNKDEDRGLIELFKIFSPAYLLKASTPNDGNSLDEKFYRELLHIIGLEEAREGSKNLIRRKTAGRDAASLMELSIDALLTENLLRKLPEASVFGANQDEIAFNAALELCIVWINRVLFLKLLEGQLAAYHGGDKAYRFMDAGTIDGFDEMFKVFHKVLAVNTADRAEALKRKYARVPYLNSSLFEIGELESQTIRINSLDGGARLALMPGTVLKGEREKNRDLPVLSYLLKFLDAYDFSGDGGHEVQEEDKTLITASVLGKVFEKINGYKDGSVFTPTFITMYMCRESIRMTVLEKFNAALSENGGTKIETFEELKSYTSGLFKANDLLKANAIVDSIRICDPAVGSGHFLVSALNEIICIKAELMILADGGRRINAYLIEVINDELTVQYRDGGIAGYKMIGGKPGSQNSQLLQKTLFLEKQKIIENCLFGVDINPNSVKICRLRLWIELLKNAYYKEETGYAELETFPNIDINIKCGNSLLSRFPLDADLAKALKSIKYSLDAYKGFVNAYKNEKNRDVKMGLQQMIDGIKADFRTEIFKNHPKALKLGKLGGELFNLMNQTKLFEENAKQEKERLRLQESLESEINRLSKEIEGIKTNALYKNAFEWRFEFPEVLDAQGGFEGFDLILGNPPYIKEDANREAFNGLRELPCYQGKMDIWYLFGGLGLSLLKPGGNLCYIATNNWTTNAGASAFRDFMLANSQIISLTDFGAYMVFDSAAIQTMIMLFKNDKEADNYVFEYRRLEGAKNTREQVLGFLAGIENKNNCYLKPTINKTDLYGKTLTFNSDLHSDLLTKIKKKHNFFIRAGEDKTLNLKTEFGNGIDVMQDFVSIAAAEKMAGKANIGDGVFVISQAEYQSKKFSSKEKEIIKPYFTSKQLSKYYGIPNNTHWVIYTKSDINKPDKNTGKVPINGFPKIKAHLDFFKPIITSAFAPYGLNRAREQYLFEGPKIMGQRKCPKEPAFTYTEFDCYVSRAFIIIQSDRINLKYLTGLLNSKLVAFWLRKKGKMQGNNYQLDKEPLLEIPIHKPTDGQSEKIAALVDKIIELKKQGKDSKKEESAIDAAVFKLYGLTVEEIKMIENSGV